MLDLLSACLGYLVDESHLAYKHGRRGLGTISLPFISSPAYVMHG